MYFTGHRSTVGFDVVVGLLVIGAGKLNLMYIVHGHRVEKESSLFWT
ncbi:hypothetical protein REC12_19925 [Desulfosporosinus sp. PR]|nr:hypothetical protein [Desulfosporosinus sp. PR]